MNREQIQALQSQVCRHPTAAAAFSELQRQRLININIPVAFRFYSEQWDAYRRDFKFTSRHSLYPQDESDNGTNVTRDPNLLSTRMTFSRHLKVADDLCLVFEMIIGEDVTHDSDGRMEDTPYNLFALYDHQGNIREFFSYYWKFERTRYYEHPENTPRDFVLSTNCGFNSGAYISREMIKQGFFVHGDLVADGRLSIANKESSIFVHLTKVELNTLNEEPVGCGDIIRYGWEVEYRHIATFAPTIVDTVNATSEQVTAFRESVFTCLDVILKNLRDILREQEAIARDAQEAADARKEAEEKLRSRDDGGNIKGYPIHRPTPQHFVRAKPDDPCLTTRDNLSFFERLGRAIRNF